MRTIKEPKWHASKAVSWRYQCRRTEVASHPIIMNSDVEDYLLDRAVEAFEIADADGELLGVVWSTPDPYPVRYMHRWHTRTADLASLKTAGSRKAAAIGLLHRQRMERKEAKAKAADMAALADIVI